LKYSFHAEAEKELNDTIGHPFINVESVYWPSTTKASNDIYAFAMGMADGVASPGSKLNKKFVWPVRGGK
jgi:hypothetical protein